MLKIDYKFKDESLLRLAMTHSSYANEHHGTHLQCNERLEFLGDSVLGFVTAGSVAGAAAGNAVGRVGKLLK